jgi:hypothetical protein
MQEITSVMKELLNKPLPPEAISQHPTKTFLSSIKAIYVEERLNDVFGIGAWTTKVSKADEGETAVNKAGKAPTMVVVKVVLEIPAYGIYHECYGGNDNSDLGDAYKGATTDAITKIASYLGIGMEIYKGKGNTASKPKSVVEAKGEPFPSSTLIKGSAPTPQEITEDDFQL